MDPRPDNFCKLFEMIRKLYSFKFGLHLTLAKSLSLLGVQELRIKPCPVVFVAFSGGPKACMYKLFQVNFVKS